MPTRARMAPDPKLEAVLARLCERLGGRIWKTQAVKLPYLVDLTAVQVRGEKVTETLHEAWDMGVVATSAWSLMKHEDGGDYFEVVVARHSEDAWELVLKESPPVELDEQEIEIIDFVAEEYGLWPLDELMTLTKKINPEIKRWGQLKRPEGVSDKVAMPPIANVKVEETESAYKRLPLWFGEAEADAEFARQRLREIEEDPARLVSAEGFLEELAE